MVISIKKNHIANVFWTITVISFCFQCYFPVLSRFIVPCLAVFLLFEFPSMNFGKVKEWVELYAFFFAYLILSLLIGAFHSGINSNSFRFFVILLIIPLAELIEESDFNLEWKSFQWILVARTIPVLYTWSQLFISQNYYSYRQWALETGAGDIYIINRIPRVQLKGSSLFVMAFIIDLYRRKKITPFGLLMILGAVMSGNAAYVLGITVGIFFFFLPTLKKWHVRKSWKVIVIIPLIIIGIAIFTKYSINSMSEKTESSNAVRNGQAELLLDTNPIVGLGLGHSISGNITNRSYSGNTYFELQTLYILNQIGIVGLLIFYILTFSQYLGCNKRYQLYAYLSYLIYTFWNPYCFDSTHIIALIIISNAITNENYKNLKEFKNFKYQ